MENVMLICDIVLLLFAATSIILGAMIGIEALGVVCVAFGVGTAVGMRVVSYLARNY